MSYSTGARAANKEALKVAIAAQFALIVASQPCHARDQAAVLGNANAAIDMLPDDPEKDVSVSISGYLSWNTPVQRGSDEEQTVPLTTVSISCSANLVTREVRSDSGVTSVEE